MQDQPALNLQTASRDELIARIRELETSIPAPSEEIVPLRSNIVSTFLDTLPVGIAYLDKNLTYHYANESYLSYLQMPKKSVVGVHLRNVLSTEVYESAKRAIAGVLAGTPASFDNALKSGEAIRHLNVNYFPDADETGDILGFYVFIKDITAQYHLQNELQGSERKYQDLVEAIPYGIEEITVEGDILFANATYHRQYGYEPGDLIGKNVTQMMATPEQSQALLAHLKKTAKDQPEPDIFVGKKRKKNGDLIDVQIVWTYKRNNAGDVLGFIAIVSDITAQLIADQEQKDAADHLKLSLQSAKIGTFYWDIRKNETYWDDRMHDIWGMPRGSFCNHTHDQFLNTLYPEDRERLDQGLEKALKDGGLFNVEYRITRPNGETVDVEVMASPVLNSAGEAVQLNGVCLDISERKTIEKLKSEFVSTVSHELRTPLTSLRGALGLVSGGALGVIPDQALEIVRMAEKNANALAILVNDILDFERADAGKLEFTFERFELIAFLANTVVGHQGLADEYKVKFRLSYDTPRVEVEADRTRIAQVLANLLSNAAKYAPENDTVEIFVQSDATHVCVSVNDQGVGIPEEYQDSVFERFTQASATDDRHFGGAGLGLSISKLIIDHHQGEIGFTTSPETGTTFEFKIPRWQNSG